MARPRNEVVDESVTKQGRAVQTDLPSTQETPAACYCKCKLGFSFSAVGSRFWQAIEAALMLVLQLTLSVGRWITETWAFNGSMRDARGLGVG